MAAAAGSLATWDVQMWKDFCFFFSLFACIIIEIEPDRKIQITILKHEKVHSLLQPAPPQQCLGKQPGIFLAPMSHRSSRFRPKPVVWSLNRSAFCFLLLQTYLTEGGLHWEPLLCHPEPGPEIKNENVALQDNLSFKFWVENKLPFLIDGWAEQSHPCNNFPFVVKLLPYAPEPVNICMCVCMLVFMLFQFHPTLYLRFSG